MSTIRNIKQSIYDWPTPIVRMLMFANKLMKQEEIDRAIDAFAEMPLTSLERRSLKKAIIRDLYRHWITPEEYFLFNFASLSEEAKREFVGDMERSVILGRLYNSSEQAKVFASKAKTFEHFAKFMKRDLIEIASAADRDTFASFVERHDKYILKPTRGDGGHGIRIETAPSDRQLETVFRDYLNEAPLVLEELIDQDTKMATLHPASVNTVRFTTYYDRGECTAIQPFLKIGQGSAIVDNGALGGILATIDERSGVVSSCGRTEDGKFYSTHPDTNVQIKGFQIPDWNELLALVAELVQVLPGQKYVGWDLAYSATKGWLMVEGNSGGAFIGQQMPQPKGIGPIIQKTLGRL